MKRRACVMVFGLFVAMIGVSTLVGAEDKDADKKDKDKLQGTWNAVSGESGGKEQKEATEHSLVFEGDKFSVKKSEKVMVKGTFKVDASKKPKEIDMEIADGPDDVKGKTALGIYKLEGDELTWCVDEPGSGNRPKEFATKEGTKTMLVKLKKK